MAEVSVAACADYNPENCRRALEQALKPVGGLSWVKPGMCIAVKANLVSYLKPEAAATTHPALLCQLTQMLRQRGARVIVGDSPGGLYTNAYVSRIYAATGMHEAEKAGAELNRDFTQKQAQFPQAMVAKEFQYTAWLDQADAVINFCKLKSHGMMGMSAAAKNLFGTIPGTMKPEYHFRFPNPQDFARMIVDLDEYWKPALSIADAVVGMEGNGPTMGTPRHIGAVLASTSPHKLDLACARLIGLQRQDVPTLQAAFERGLIPESVQQLDVAGDLEALVVRDFQNIETKNSLLFKNQFKGTAGEAFGRLAKACLGARPKVDKADCVGCGKCAGICPAKAITMRKNLPAIDRSACIRCFCCQEFCPKGAMRAARPAIARVLNR